MDGKQQGGPPPGHQRRPSQGSQGGGPPPGMPRSRSGSQSSQQARPPSLDVTQHTPALPTGRPNPLNPGQKNPYGPTLGCDPARGRMEEAKRREKEVPNRMDLPPEAFMMVCITIILSPYTYSKLFAQILIILLIYRRARILRSPLALATTKRTNLSTFGSTSTALSMQLL